MRKTKYPIHPDFKRWARLNPPLYKPLLPLMRGPLGLLFWLERSDRQVTVARKAIPRADGTALRALLYEPVGLGPDAPLLVLCHGGGFVFPAAPYHYALAREYARRVPCRVLLPHYRLAPKHPFPAAQEDAYAAYAWALANARALGTDAARVAVGGDSAGGQLATVVCLMARDRGLRVPCAQLLLYPTVGAGPDSESMRQFTDTPMCNSRDIARYGRLYQPDPAVGPRAYAAPIEAESLAGLPPAYVETAEFDCLRDGGVLYAERLRAAGAPVELNNTKGTMHGFDIVLRSPITRACVDRRIAFLRRGMGER